MDRRDAALNIALIVMSVTLVFAGLEVSLRLDLVGSQQPDGPELRACSGFDLDSPEQLQAEQTMPSHPVYGWRHKPDIQYLRKETSEQDWARFTINSAGFRDTYDSGDRNVIVVGDSFTEGYLADDNESFPALLDRWSPSRAFHNFGTAGYATDQELLVYRNVADDIEHETVIVGFYLHNDLRDNVESGVVVDESNRFRPKTVLVDDGVEIIPANEAVQSAEHDSKREESQSGSRGLVGAVLSHPVVNGIQSFLSDHTASYPYLSSRIGNLIAGPPSPPSGEQLDEQLRVTRALLNEFSREAETHDARVLIVAIPERGDVNPDNPAYYLAEDGERYWEAQRELLADVAAARDNVGVVDVESDLRSKVENGTRVYGEIDPHLNERGYDVVARAIASRLGIEPPATSNVSIASPKGCS
jgi:hypothetical protein